LVLAVAIEKKKGVLAIERLERGERERERQERTKI
jgi:hypothetical protein